jgi:hypothetical protein
LTSFAVEKRLSGLEEFLNSAAGHPVLPLDLQRQDQELDDQPFGC